MAFPTAVNSQITDAVTQSNVKVLGEAPAMALGSQEQTIAEAVGIVGEDTVANQQAMGQVTQSGTPDVESLDEGGE